MTKLFAVVPAAGVGKRMGGAKPKQYLELAGQTVLGHTLSRLAAHPRMQSIAVAVSADDPFFDALRASLPAICRRVSGGAERCHSVMAGLNALAESADAQDWVLVHDAARPCVRHQDIERMLRELSGSNIGGILAVPVRDTLKRGDETQAIISTIDRTSLWHALTPQLFRYGLLTQALQAALDQGQLVTDEAQAVERLGYKPQLVVGSSDNIKITHSQDLALAAMILAAQSAETGG